MVKNENKQEPKWLYRLESRSKDNGLWYNDYSEFVFGVNEAPNCSSKDLPMEYDERYEKDGKNWHSACSRIEDLTHWYSIDNAKWLLDNGFVFTKYLATEYVEYEKETTFIKDTSLDRKEILLSEVFGEGLKNY